jgi:ABC-type Fe3+-hydroxamate transport system substrate-binding protein
MWLFNSACADIAAGSCCGWVVSHVTCCSGAVAAAAAASCRSFADPGVLNRAEWVKFVAVFFNKEVEAERLFNNITADYQKLNASARAAAGAEGKTVAWLTQFGDTFTVNYAQYKKEYMQVGEPFS